MAGDSDTIKEFLVALGFDVQPASLRQFTSALKGSDKLVTKLGTSVVAVAAAAEAMVLTFARQMENLYYVSRRTGASVKNLQAIRFGAQQIGVSAEDATAAVKSLADALKFSPGTVGVFARLTGHMPGQDNEKNLEELARAINKMNKPDYIKAQYAGLFGMTTDQFLMFIKHIDEAVDAGKRLSKMYADAGVNQQEAAEAGKIYMNTLRDIWATIEVTGNAFALKLLGPFQEFAGYVREAISVLPQLDLSFENSQKVFDQWWDDISDPKRNIGKFLKDQLYSVLGFITAPVDKIIGWMAEKKQGEGGGTSIFPPGQPGGGTRLAAGGIRAAPTSDRQKYEQWADAAADANNIPRALFRSLIQSESTWDPNADASKNDPRSHAWGLTQLQPGTARGEGVDAHDPFQNIKGGASYLAKMYAKTGNWRDALAAYHEGPGGVLPNAYGYADKILGRTGGEVGGRSVALNQTINITVKGDPKDASKLASAIASEVGRSTANIVRDQTGAIDTP